MIAFVREISACGVPSAAVPFAFPFVFLRLPLRAGGGLIAGPGRGSPAARREIFFYNKNRLLKPPYCAILIINNHLLIYEEAYFRFKVKLLFSPGKFRNGRDRLRRKE